MVVFYSLNFQAEMEKVMARIMTLEMKSIGNAVKVKPNIQFNDVTLPIGAKNASDMEKMPKELEAFPNTKNMTASNGLLSVKLNKANHLSKGLDQPLLFLVGLRQYMQYHI